jgi:hypothetical protein
VTADQDAVTLAEFTAALSLAADQAAGLSLEDPAEVTEVVSPERRYWPQPVSDRAWAWKTSISATEPEAFENLAQFAATPEF